MKILQFLTFLSAALTAALWIGPELPVFKLSISLWDLFAWYLLTLPLWTWISYLAIMAIKRKKNQLTPVAKVVAYLYLFLVAYPQDILLRLTWGVVLFFEVPPILTSTVTLWGKQYMIYYPELLFTQLVTRHKEGPDGRRKDLANWCCANWLDPLDLNDSHCK